MEKEKYIINNEAILRIALERLNECASKVLFIVDDKNKLVGALSDGDIRRWILKNGSLDDSVNLIMNDSPCFMTSLDDYECTAIEIMKKYNIPAIPVVNEDKTIKKIYWLNQSYDMEKNQSIRLKVVVMAGGKGERLLPYTSIVPKPLIPIGEKPISELVMDSFKRYGCEEFYFTLNYKKNMIKAYYDELKDQYNVLYIEEDEPLGTGGSLYYLKDKINETFFVSNCDIILDVDYADVYKFHKENNNLLTIITSIKKYTVPYGIVNIDEHGQIASLQEKPSRDYLVNTGVYLIEPEIFDYLKRKEFIHITELIEKCLKNGDRVGTYPISEDAWMDMGQFEDMEKMKKKFMV